MLRGPDVSVSGGRPLFGALVGKTLHSHWKLVGPLRRGLARHLVGLRAVAVTPARKSLIPTNTSGVRNLLLLIFFLRTSSRKFRRAYVHRITQVSAES